MNTKHYSYFFIIISIIALALLIYAQKREHISTTDGKRVICTTTIIADTVRQIAGEHLHVVSIMGPGVDPHTYKAREGDMRLLATADIIFYHGLHLEGRMAYMLDKMNQYTCTVAVTDCLDRKLLLESDTPGIYDPHIWHDISLWQEVAEYIGKQLALCDPEHAELYTKNTLSYCATLAKLDRRIRTQINRLKPEQRILVTAHDAFSYFGRAYNFTVIGLQGISTDAEISMHDVQNVAELTARYKIKSLFFESSIPERTIRAVQQAVHACNWHVNAGSELFSDSLDSPENPAGSYQGMLHYNVSHIVNDLI